MVNGPLRYYLAEWYRAEFTTCPVSEVVEQLTTGIAATRTEAASVRLILAMVVPTDEVLYCLFEASSSAVVIEACQRADMRPARLSTDIDALLPLETTDEVVDPHSGSTNAWSRPDIHGVSNRRECLSTPRHRGTHH